MTLPPHLKSEAEAAAQAKYSRSDRVFAETFLAGIDWLFSRLCEMSEFADKKSADEILHDYSQPNEPTDEGNLFFAATAYRNAYVASQAALLKARQLYLDMRDGHEHVVHKMHAEFQAERARCERYEKALETYLDNEHCRKTSCPFPTRAMCRNPMHQLARQSLSEGDE